MPTIGFSHKNKTWTSRYSYVASCMGAVNKSFISSPAAPDFNAQQTSPIWVHNSPNSGDYNKFYGARHPSMISASFSQTPSQNKLIKSASIEGSKNLDDCIIQFSTQDDLDSNGSTTVSLSQAQEVNGTTYMPIPKSPFQQVGRALQVLGVIDNSSMLENPAVLASDPAEVEVPEGGREDAVNSGRKRFNNQYLSVKVKDGFVNNSIYFDDTTPSYYVFFQFSESAGITFPSSVFAITNSVGATDAFASLALGEQVTYSNVFSDSAFLTGTNMPADSGIPNYDAATSRFNVNIGQMDSANVAFSANTSLAEGTWYLGSFSHEKFTGDFQRGQTSEAAILFPKDMGYFELYAMNLNYEPLALSHDK